MFSLLFHHQHIEASITARGTAASKVLLLGSFFGWITRRHAWDGTESKHMCGTRKNFSLVVGILILWKCGRYLDAGKDKVKGPGAENPENKNGISSKAFSLDHLLRSGPSLGFTIPNPRLTMMTSLQRKIVITFLLFWILSDMLTSLPASSSHRTQPQLPRSSPPWPAIKQTVHLIRSKDCVHLIYCPAVCCQIQK